MDGTKVAQEGAVTPIETSPNLLSVYAWGPQDPSDGRLLKTTIGRYPPTT